MLPGIHGLRGIAALAVVMYHLVHLVKNCSAGRIRLHRQRFRKWCPFVLCNQRFFADALDRINVASPIVGIGVLRQTIFSHRAAVLLHSGGHGSLESLPLANFRTKP